MVVTAQRHAIDVASLAGTHGWVPLAAEFRTPGWTRTLYLVAGALVLVAVTVDLLWTTLWTDGGAGPLSVQLTSLVWTGLRATENRFPRATSLAGPAVLVLTLAMWVGLIWAGWTLIFAGGQNALFDTRNPGPVSWAERAYFVAYSMFTMGNGDFAPRDGWWQIATALTTGSGMLFVTLAVSYVLSVLGAVVDKRAFANHVAGLGRRSEAFVRSGWDGEDLGDLDPLLNDFAASLHRLSKQHQAYPILHYYHSERPVDSSATAVAVLDDALTLVRFGVPPDERPNEALVEAARASVGSYLHTLGPTYIDPADEVPPPPDLAELREAGVPTTSPAAFDESLEELTDRRRALRGAVRADAWRWLPDDDE